MDVLIHGFCNLEDDWKEDQFQEMILAKFWFMEVVDFIR